MIGGLMSELLNYSKTPEKNKFELLGIEIYGIQIADN
jgi:hypothetical protein